MIVIFSEIVTDHHGEQCLFRDMAREKHKFSFDTKKQMREKIIALAAEFKRLARFLPCIYYVTTGQ